jgi:Mg-chelatase subunit ChlD
MKFIEHEAEGAGKCADEWSVKRLQYKNCNMKRCQTLEVSKPLTCNKSLDIILLIDGSGSLGKGGWEAEIIAAKAFINAFHMAADGNFNMAVILFSGPRTWSGVSKCMGKNKQTVSLPDCGIKTVTHFTTDLSKVDQLVTGLDWPQGSTLTSLALMTAKAEMALGRGDEQTIVVVFTDGRPLSYRKTGLASRTIRKSARLVWVPVTKYAPLKKIKKWATRRWQENVVPVENFDDLKKPDVITHIIADICPKSDADLKFTRR